MKAIYRLTILIVTVSLLFTSCAFVKTTNDSETINDKPIRVLALKGPTGMGMSKLATDSKNGIHKNYKFTFASSPDQLTGDIIQGKFEFAAVPTNLASLLYNKTNGELSVIAINTIGGLCILENGSNIKSINDLNGQTIISSGKGAVPEYALNFILDTMDIKCDVVYEAEHDAVVTDLITGNAKIGLLPEPKVTAVLKNENAPKDMRIALDLTKLWKESCKINGLSSELYMGCLIVNNKWAKDNKSMLIEFLKAYKKSIVFVNNNPGEASKLIAENGIIPSEKIALSSLENTSTVLICGKEMKQGLKDFFEILYKYNPASIGGKLPRDDFYNLTNAD